MSVALSTVIFAPMSQFCTPLPASVPTSVPRTRRQCPLPYPMPETRAHFRTPCPIPVPTLVPHSRYQCPGMYPHTQCQYPVITFDTDTSHYHGPAMYRHNRLRSTIP
eukprot:1944786-Rhodomonas_salina.1